MARDIKRSIRNRVFAEDWRVSTLSYFPLSRAYVAAGLIFESFSPGANPNGGWLSDRTGRKPLTQWYCLFLVFGGIPVFYVLYHAAIARNIKMAVLGTCMAAMLKLAWGVVPAYLCERFPTSRRAAGVGFGYSSGALLGAWFGVYVAWAHKIPFIAHIEKQDMWLSPAVVLTIGSAMTIGSLFFSPETKHLELHEVGSQYAMPELEPQIAAATAD